MGRGATHIDSPLCSILSATGRKMRLRNATVERRCLLFSMLEMPEVESSGVGSDLQIFAKIRHKFKEAIHK